jgi:hypothetical protein
MTNKTEQLTAAEALALKVRIANEPHKQRIADELSVVRVLCETAIAAGYAVSLSDGEEWTVKSSRNVDEIVAAAQTTDSDTLRVRDIENKLIVGDVCFVYGNSASEVVCDYTTGEKMEAIMGFVNKFTDKLEAEGK